MMGRIYTRKGDGGQTKTMRGVMSKGDQLAAALGTIDELNSWLGVCRGEFLADKPEILGDKRDLGSKRQYLEIESELKRMQNNLLTIGSGLAGSGRRLGSGETGRLERLIDRLTLELPELRNFVLPLGYWHVARTVARRAEREVVSAVRLNAEIGDVRQVLKYLNRLSDALFTVARWVNWRRGVAEEIWK